MFFSIEIIGYLAAFCTTFSFLPQAILTIRTKNTESLSFVMYSFFTVGVILWLIYGIDKRDYALIWANSVTLIFAVIILSFKIRSMILNKIL
jgi:MtN3 and saliva related transmembrane protein